MRNLAAVLLLLLVSPAVAQTQPKPVKTFRVEAAPAPLYRVDDDGTVWIDWRRVETVARSADLRGGDIARALVAVRDGTAKKMP